MSYASFVSMKPGWEKLVGSTKVRRLGEEGYMFPGRWFKYALAGEAVTVGLLQTGITAIAEHDLDINPAANVAVGATAVSFASLTATEDEYADGFFFINDEGTEEGHNYLIKSNNGVTAGTLTITLDEEDGLVTAITTSEQCGLVHNLAFDFVVYPSAVTAAPLGGSCVDWADNDFGWLQFRGQGVCRVDATAPSQGLALIPSNATAGNLELSSNAGTLDTPEVAAMMDSAGASGESAPVLWKI